MLLFTCGCGAKLKLRDEYAGRRAKCPRCGRVQRVHAESSGDLPLPGTAAAEYVEMRRETEPPSPSSGIEIDEDYIETLEAKLPVQDRGEPVDADDLEIHTVDDLEESTPRPSASSKRQAPEPELAEDDDALFSAAHEAHEEDEDDLPLGARPKAKKSDEEDSFFDAAVDEMGQEDDNGGKPRSRDEETVEISEFHAEQEDDEDDAPKARKKRAADDDEYAIPRKKKKRRRAEEEDEDAEEPVLAREDKPKTKISGKAIIALVLGIFGVCFAPLAIPLGVLALREMKARPGELRGRGMAWAGIILGALSLLAMLAVGAFYLWIAISLAR